MDPSLAVDVVETLAAYEGRYGAPSGPVDVLQAALEAGRSVIGRSDFPVHVTCGAIIRDPGGRVLQIRHRTLGRWFFPGGHLEAGDGSLIAAARREALEETGLVVGDRDCVGADVRSIPIDIDIHPIPAHPGKGEPEHHHADFRYVLDVVEGAIRLQLDEVTAWRWADPAQTDAPHLADRLGSP